MHRFGIAATACLLSLPHSSSIHAATIRVPLDQPSILAGLDAADAGDTVLVDPGTWTERDTRVVILNSSPTSVTASGFAEAGVVLRSASGPEKTVIDLQGGIGYGILFAAQAGTFEIEGFTVTGGSEYATGVGMNAPATLFPELVVEDCVFRNGYRAIAAFTGDLSIFGCAFDDNVDSYSLVYNAGGHLTMQDSRMSSNDVGMCVRQEEGTSTIEGCEFIGNQAYDSIVQLVFATSGIVEDNLFLRNTVTRGSLWAWGNDFTIRGNTFAYGVAVPDIYGQYGYAGGLFTGSEFSGSIDSNTFFGCQAELYGAAVVISIANGSTDFDHNLISTCSGTAEEIPAVTVLQETSLLETGCNLFWNNGPENHSGNWPGSPTDVFEDPLICSLNDPDETEYTVASGSPCLDGNTPDCTQIGAWGQGCAVSSIASTSWGQIKALYR